MAGADPMQTYDFASDEIGHELLQCAIGLERPCTPLLALCRH
jgi:hypothetical protein